MTSDFHIAFHDKSDITRIAKQRVRHRFFKWNQCGIQKCRSQKLNFSWIPNLIRNYIFFAVYLYCEIKNARSTCVMLNSTLNSLRIFMAHMSIFPWNMRLTNTKLSLLSSRTGYWCDLLTTISNFIYRCFQEKCHVSNHTEDHKTGKETCTAID